VSPVEEVLDGQAVEEDATVGTSEEGEVRRLPVHKRVGELDLLRGEVTTAALAAAGGVVAGAATVAVVRAIGAVGRHRGSRVVTRGRRPAKVVASRSFLVDVHVLGDR
jgi:hypothetical protein